MSSSTKRGVTQNPRENDQGLRRSARINRKPPGGHVRKPEGIQKKRTISNKDTKMPKIVKSASPTEKQKLDILRSHRNDDTTVIKSHEDSHGSKSKTSSKASFWGSPDISSGIEDLFEAMGLYNKSKSLIISLNLCSIKNMIQLSDLDLYEVGN